MGRETGKDFGGRKLWVAELSWRSTAEMAEMARGSRAAAELASGCVAAIEPAGE